MKILVTIRSNDIEIPSIDVEGEAPFADCPIAVTRVYVFDDALREWQPGKEWCVTHRATGYRLGKNSWSTKAEALAVLERADPSFAAWPLAVGSIEDTATIACFVKFRAACAA
jgi:hypothetical protein